MSHLSNSWFWECSTIPYWHTHRCSWCQPQVDSWHESSLFLAQFFLNPTHASLHQLHGFSGWKQPEVAPVHWGTPLHQTWAPWLYPLPQNGLLSSHHLSKTPISFLLMSTRALEGNNGSIQIHTKRYWMTSSFDLNDKSSNWPFPLVQLHRAFGWSVTHRKYWGPLSHPICFPTLPRYPPLLPRT